MSRTHVTCTVNGDEVDFLTDDSETLLHALRDEVGLTGAKEGCSTGDCGACTVRAERPHRLLVPGVRARGRRRHDRHRSRAWPTATTSTPCSSPSSRTPRSSAPSARRASCSTAKALLDANPDPTETEIRYGLAGNLCRCTGYDKIVRAVQEAAAIMREATV